jgi:protocatechuate 3,4-dioxygenase beta subunit
VKRFLIEVQPSGTRADRREYRERTRRRRAARATGAGGEFELELPQDGAVVTILGAGDTQSAPAVIGADPGAAPWQFVLPRPASVLGRVCDSLGEPVADCPVLLGYPGQDLPSLQHENVDLDGSRDWTSDPRFCARSGADGRFELRAVCPPALLLAAVGSGGAESDWTRVELDPDQPAEVTVTLFTGARVVGWIDPSLGDPSGRQVDLFSFRGSRGWRTTRSGVDGSFRIDNVIPQAYVIELRPPGYPKEEIEIGDDGAARIVRDGATRIPSIRRNLTVAPGAEVEVRFGRATEIVRVAGVVTVGGIASANQWLSLHPCGGQDDLGLRAKTDGDGRFALDLPAPGAWRLGSEDGSAPSFDFTVPQDQASLPETFELAIDWPGGEISGRVVDAAGHPLERVGVTLLLDPPAGAPPDDHFWARFERDTTDREGRFRFPYRTSGRYTLRAPDGLGFSIPPPRFEWGRVVIPDLVVDGRPLPPFDVVVAPEARLAGRVVDRAGRPVSEARIDVLDAAGRLQSAFSEVESDATGAFHHLSLAPGVVEVVARFRGREGRRAGVVLAAATVAQVEIVID